MTKHFLPRPLAHPEAFAQAVPSARNAFPLTPILGDPKPAASRLWLAKLDWGKPAPHSHPGASQAPGSTPGASLGCKEFRVRLGSHRLSPGPEASWGGAASRLGCPPGSVRAPRRSRGLFLGGSKSRRFPEEACVAQKLQGPRLPASVPPPVCPPLALALPVGPGRVPSSLTLSVCATGDYQRRLCAWPAPAAGDSETDSAPAAPGCGAGCAPHESSQPRG